MASVLAQDYPGPVRVTIVYDQSEPDQRLASDDRIRVLPNTRKPGLAGARNTGILTADAEFVAFCDDDDEWLPGKLQAQVSALQANPAAEFATCGIEVNYAGRSFARQTTSSQVTHADLLRSRMMMVHSSTYLIDRDALINEIGLVDEQLPGGHNEDWDLALRASRRQPIVNVSTPLVKVFWTAPSYFDLDWDAKSESLRCMLARYPGIAADRRGAARVYGQLAFGSACLGRRREAGTWAWRALKARPGELRAPIALAVALGLTSGGAVLRVLHARGHGI